MEDNMVEANYWDITSSFSGGMIIEGIRQLLVKNMKPGDKIRSVEISSDNIGISTDQNRFLLITIKCAE